MSSPVRSLEGDVSHFDEDKNVKNLKNKLATTQKQLRRAFIENAEMSRTLQKLKLQATKSNIDQIPNIANYGDKSSLQHPEGNSANQSEPAIANALRNDDDDAASPSPADNVEALANPVSKHDIAIGFADIGPNHQQRLSLIRLTNGCIVISAVCDFGRCDIFPKLIRSNNIGVLDVAKNVVNMVVRPTNELLKIVFRGPKEAAGFAHNLHAFIQRNERNMEEESEQLRSK